MDQEIASSHEQPSRPRTRAWVKQQKGETTEIAPIQKTNLLPRIRKKLQTPGPSQIQAKKAKQDRRPQGTPRTKNPPQQKSGPILSQAAAIKPPKKSRRQVDTAGAKRPQQRRGAAQGQVVTLDRVVAERSPQGRNAAREQVSMEKIFRSITSKLIM